MGFGQCRRVIHACGVRVQFFHHVAHEAAAAQQVAAKLFDELLEARLALGAGRFLMRFGNRRADGQEVADEQRQRFDLDVLVTLQAPIEMGLERCLEYIQADELLEVTPKSIRMRKRQLPKR